MTRSVLPASVLKGIVGSRNEFTMKRIRRMPMRKAFTLIELLVVIAIIALLLSILMPGLSNAKRFAQGAVCLANESQLIKAYLLYAEDNNSHLVDGDTSDNYGVNAGFSTYDRRSFGGEIVRARNWVGAPMNENRAPSNESLDDKVRGYQAGALWPYIEAPDAYHCPADLRWRQYGPGMGMMGYRTYSIGKPLSKQYPNVLFGEVDCEISKVTEFISPGSKIVFIEETEKMHGWNHRTWNMSLDIANPQWVDPFAAMHNRSSTFAFADGHAERRIWKNKTTIKMATEGTKHQSATVTGQPGGGPSEDYIWFRKAYIPGRVPDTLR